jgi:hypothetical protein
MIIQIQVLLFSISL